MPTVRKSTHSNDYVSNRIEGMMFRAPVYQTATGTLNTNGTAVVTAAGISKFGTNWASGSNILINGTAYTIAFVNSNTQITLTTTILQHQVYLMLIKRTLGL